MYCLWMKRSGSLFPLISLMEGEYEVTLADGSRGGGERSCKRMGYRELRQATEALRLASTAHVLTVRAKYGPSTGLCLTDETQWTR